MSDAVDFRPKRRFVKRVSAPISVRLSAYLAAVFAKGTRVYTVDFDALARRFRCTRRTVEMAVKKVREAGRFVFRTVRAGRSYAVQVSDRNPSIKGVFPLKRKKEIQINTTPAARGFKKSSHWVSKPTPRRILALAGWLARHELGRMHRAASRTMFRIGHALNFASEALHSGHARADIVDAYGYALRSVDSDLAHLPASVRWEPSSLIRLARRRLADGLAVSDRVAIRRLALSVAAANRPAPVVIEAPFKTAADFASEFDALCAAQ